MTSLRKCRNDRGVVAIEFVFIAPLLLMLVFAVANFGGYYFKKVDVASTARDAARSLALRQSIPALPSGWTTTGVTTCAAGDTTSNAEVTLNATYVFSIPGLPLADETISVTGRMRCGG